MFTKMVSHVFYSRERKHLLLHIFYNFLESPSKRKDVHIDVSYISKKIKKIKILKIYFLIDYCVEGRKENCKNSPTLEISLFEIEIWYM